MTKGQRLAHKTPAERRAFEAAHTILEGSGLRYQSAQIDGLALVLMAFAENENAPLRAAEAEIARLHQALSKLRMDGIFGLEVPPTTKELADDPEFATVVDVDSSAEEIARALDLYIDRLLS
jgi:hypothetical protein